MQFLLQVSAGPYAGRKLVLLKGDTVAVGRGEMNRFSLPSDAQISDRHFTLHYDGRRCLLTDLDSSNGTFLNGIRAEKVLVEEGDEISAGSTRFQIVREGEPTSAATGDDALRVEGRYTLDLCQSKLAKFTGQGDRPLAAELLECLPEQLRTYWMVDNEKLQQPVPPEIESPEYLFDWLPKSVIGRMSPVILAASDPVDLRAILAQAWKKDALSIALSNLDRKPLLDHLRLTARGQYGQHSVPTAEEMITSCRPSAFRPFLAGHTRTAYIDHLFSGVEGFLFEPEKEGLWEILAPATFVEKLHAAGLKPLKR
ncbi:MAG: FHA domain-containing protein [Thermoguttaceae bacterium]